MCKILARIRRNLKTPINTTVSDALPPKSQRGAAR